MAGSRIFICRVCGNIVMLVHKGGGPLSCCGQPMEELVANTTDAAQEKHVPVIAKGLQELIVFSVNTFILSNTFITCSR